VEANGALLSMFFGGGGGMGCGSDCGLGLVLRGIMGCDEDLVPNCLPRVKKNTFVASNVVTG
jgi:hypothetical protein